MLDYRWLARFLQGARRMIRSTEALRIDTVDILSLRGRRPRVGLYAAAHNPSRG